MIPVILRKFCGCVIFCYFAGLGPIHIIYCLIDTFFYLSYFHQSFLLIFLASWKLLFFFWELTLSWETTTRPPRRICSDQICFVHPGFLHSRLCHLSYRARLAVPGGVPELLHCHRYRQYFGRFPLHIKIDFPFTQNWEIEMFIFAVIDKMSIAMPIPLKVVN